MNEMIARVQRLLSASGFPAGRADGIAGEKTLAAWGEYLQTIDLSGRWPDGRRDASLNAFFGPKGTGLCRIRLPYAMRLSWALETRITSIFCHELVSGSLTRALRSILDHVGGDLDELRFYGLDIFGGCYSLRKMRGGSRWSRHSWGIAIDLDPERNGLRTPWPGVATMPIFAVEAFVDLGWTSGAAHWRRDAMHFEATRPEPLS